MEAAMQLGPFGKHALGLALGLAITVPARAEVQPCDGIGSSGPMCPTPTACTHDAQCAGLGLGRCVAGACADDCGSLFTCSGRDDCPAFTGVTATCQMAAISGPGSGVCVYADPDAHSVTTLCTTASTTASLAQVRACFSGGSDWRQGDCDGDGVRNGVDADPCRFDVTSMITREASPFCLPGRICEGTTSVCAPILRCGAMSDCVAAVASFATQSWECLGIAGSSIHVCQPSCFATAQCTLGSTLDCGPFGTCVSTGSLHGFCQAAAISGCAASCSVDPLDWASPSGDCDGDGAQNGCDVHVCATTAGDTACVANESVCAPLDAGIVPVDGGAIIPDASVATPDGGDQADASVEDDASTAGDGGVATPDASASMDGGASSADAGVTTIPPGLGFGGGGGCRCAVPSEHGRGPTGAVFVVLGIAAILGRRRR
jgi:MYXO-CTERM domain-containing protein